jgi:PilZ domain-containing protein
MTEVSSNTIYVVGDRLPWPDDSSPMREKGTFDSGVLIDSGLRTPCSIRKISALGAMLMTDQKKLAGSQVAVELGNGQRPSGKVDWVDRRELGIRFDEPVDLLALINRTLVSQPVERRSMPRVELRCPVHVKYGEHFEPATMRNISARGLQIEGPSLPSAGTYIAVFVEGLNIPAGEVVWSRGNLAGIEVFEELSWTSIIPWVRDVIRKGGH